MSPSSFLLDTVVGLRKKFSGMASSDVISPITISVSRHGCPERWSPNWSEATADVTKEQQLRMKLDN